jgi:molybdate transport system substrate-binding protein
MAKMRREPERAFKRQGVDGVRARCISTFVKLLTGLLAAWLPMTFCHAQAVTVFAAASLKEALDEIDATYQKRAGEKAVISYASTSALARQVESGAPAHIFISADLDWMDYLEKRKLIDTASRTNLLRNALVLVAPADSKVQLTVGPNFALAGALGNGRLAMGDPDHVPAGKYAKAALEKLGVWSAVAGKIARAENVRAALLFVSRGEAPLGIVYRTDAVADKRVRIAGVFPAGSHPAIVYRAAILASGRNNTSAQQYFSFLGSPEALGLFRKHGFVPF